jgi:ketosteroid isomerase-like protein
MVLIPALMAAFLQAAAPTPTPDPEVEPFLTLETRLSTAAKAKDMAAIDELLAKDFTFTVFVEGQAPEVLNRNEWFKAAAHYTLTGFAIRHVAARVFGNVAVVRLQPIRIATLGASVDRSGEFAIVDVWTKADGKWKLSTRHLGRPEVPVRR